VRDGRGSEGAVLGMFMEKKEREELCRRKVYGRKSTESDHVEGLVLGEGGPGASGRKGTRHQELLVKLTSDQTEDTLLVE
jgi:hypothetical protein